MSDEEFVALICRAVRNIGLRPVAEAANVSLPTVRRWMQCQNLPYSATRKAVAEAVADVTV